MGEELYSNVGEGKVGKQGELGSKAWLDLSLVLRAAPFIVQLTTQNASARVWYSPPSSMVCLGDSEKVSVSLGASVSPSKSRCLRGVFPVHC